MKKEEYELYTKEELIEALCKVSVASMIDIAKELRKIKDFRTEEEKYEYAKI